MTNTAPQTQADTFSALSDCFSADLAALISEETPHNPTPNEFINLIARVSDVLGTASVGYLQDASQDLADAVTYLTDALNGPAGDQPSLLAWARTHLRDGIEAAH